MVNHITDFFKPFIVPKNRVPDNAAEEDEIVVASPSRQLRHRHREGAARRKPASPALKHKIKRQLSREYSLSSVPSRLSPQKTLQTRSHASSLDGTTDEDDPLCHSSSTPSKQRVMMAVAVPSPKRKMSPPPKIERAAAPSRATTSFSSLSTLSSVPVSSQSSSRRIVKDGLQAVTNSDSGSADSSDELADVDTFVPHKKRKMTPPSNHAERTVHRQDTVKPARQNARLSNQSSRSRTSTPRLPPSPPRTEYKHSLLKMVKATERQRQQDLRIAEVEAQVAEAERRREEERAATAATTTVDLLEMAADLADDSDEGERMMQAMARTEAMHDDVRYTFFLDKPRKAQNGPFPVATLTYEPFANILKDDQTRAQACLTGYVADLAFEGRLSATIVGWLVRQLVHEPREELCQAYVEIVRLAMQDTAIKLGCRPPSLRTLYCTATYGITGRIDESDQPLQQEDFPVPSSQRQPEDVIKCICGHDRDDGSTVACEKLARADQSLKNALAAQPPSMAPGLRYVVRAIQYIVADAGVQSVGQAIVDLALANIDQHVRNDLELQFAIQDGIECLLESVGEVELEMVCSHVNAHILTIEQLPKILSCRLITALPASSVNAHYLRRRMALYCITQADTYKAVTCASWYTTITTRLRNAPEYTTSNSTDYALLHALTGVLDIAIDAGFSDFAFLSTQPTEPVGRGLFRTAPAKQSKDEKLFNAQVDGLAMQLKLMASRIRDAGAAHLTRTEAKSALERLVVRLEYGVRTRAKPRKDAFGGVSGEQRGSIEGFLKKGADEVLGAGTRAAETTKSANGSATIVSPPDGDEPKSPWADAIDGHVDSNGNVVVIDENVLGEQSVHAEDHTMGAAATEEEMDALSDIIGAGEPASPEKRRNSAWNALETDVRC